MKKFVCENCGKEIDLEDRIFEKAYKGQKYCLDCRALEKRGKLNGKS